VPFGFAVQTDLLPIEGLTSRSNTIRPFVRVVAPAAPENSSTHMQAVMASPPAATRCRTIGRSYARASSASRAGRWAARVLRNTLRTAVSHHRVHPRRLSEPLCAELRRPLECLEVDVDQPETVAVAVDPLEVVLGAPVEVAVDRHTVRGCVLELVEACP